MALQIRHGQKADVPAVLHLIKELAAYEQAAEQVEVTEEVLLRDGFSEQPLFRLLVADDGNGHIQGMAFYYFAYSTWKGMILYLDDLIVSQEARRSGIGRQLMEALATEAKRAGARQMRWHVLDWNEPAIKFYEALNTHLDPEWITCKMGPESIERLANGKSEQKTK